MAFFDFLKARSERKKLVKRITNPARRERYQTAKTLVIRNQMMQAISNRTNSSWYRLALQDPNDEFGNNIENLRKNSRRMTLEDNYTKSYYEALVTNVVGDSGFMFVPKIKRGKTATAGLNESVNTELKRAFNDWKKHPSVNRKGTLCDFEQDAITTTAEDGECFVNIVIDPDVNKFGFAIEILDAALLDTRFNKDQTLANGQRRKIRQGIELDKFDRPVAYWFWNRYPNSQIRRDELKRQRLPALNLDKLGIQGGVIHLHMAVNDRANALRGKPWITSVMNFLARLNQYLDAELIAAVMSSMTPGYILTDKDNPTAHTEPTFRNVNNAVLATDSDGGLIIPKGPEHEQIDMEAGTLIKLAPGETIEAPQFDRPNAQLEKTVKLYLHGIAAGLGISYNTLSADNSEETYASGRLGVQQERDQWKRIQKWFARNFHIIIYEAWLRAAIRTPQLQLPTRKASDYLDVTFKARGWQWADELRVMKAQIEQVKLGIRPPSTLAEEFGNDYDETIAQTAADFKKMEAAGLDPSLIFSTSTSVERDPPDGTRPAEEEEE